jgi:hypothetical protein
MSFYEAVGRKMRERLETQRVDREVLDRIRFTLIEDPKLTREGLRLSRRDGGIVLHHKDREVALVIASNRLIRITASDDAAAETFPDHNSALDRLAEHYAKAVLEDNANEAAA